MRTPAIKAMAPKTKELVRTNQAPRASEWNLEAFSKPTDREWHYLQSQYHQKALNDSSHWISRVATPLSMLAGAGGGVMLMVELLKTVPVVLAALLGVGLFFATIVYGVACVLEGRMLGFKSVKTLWVKLLTWHQKRTLAKAVAQKKTVVQKMLVGVERLGMSPQRVKQIQQEASMEQWDVAPRTLPKVQEHYLSMIRAQKYLYDAVQSLSEVEVYEEVLRLMEQLVQGADAQWALQWMQEIGVNQGEAFSKALSIMNKEELLSMLIRGKALLQEKQAHELKNYKYEESLKRIGLINEKIEENPSQVLDRVTSSQYRQKNNQEVLQKVNG